MFVLQEQLFDVTDLQDREPIVVSKCGTLRVTFHYQVSAGNDRLQSKLYTLNVIMMLLQTF